jgi:peroxiredoxin
MERDSSSDKFPLGAQMPPFNLPNVDGGRITSESLRGAPAVLVVFTCNHCPYVKGSEQMLVAVVTKFLSRGLKVVAINSNDATKYPEDSFEKMKEKAAASSLPYPYLYDEDQSVARAFDAACTPELYLFNGSGQLAYHGTINDSPRDASKVSRDFLSDAIAAVLDGVAPQQAFVHPVGCSIKWK